MFIRCFYAENLVSFYLRLKLENDFDKKKRAGSERSSGKGVVRWILPMNHQFRSKLLQDSKFSQIFALKFRKFIFSFLFRLLIDYSCEGISSTYNLLISVLLRYPELLVVYLFRWTCLIFDFALETLLFSLFTSLLFLFFWPPKFFANFKIPRTMIHFDWAMIKLGNLWLVWLIFITLMTTAWRCLLSKRTHRIEIFLETEIYFCPAHERRGNGCAQRWSEVVPCE